MRKPTIAYIWEEVLVEEKWSNVQGQPYSWSGCNGRGYHFQVMGCNWIGGCRRRVLVDQHSYRSYLGDLSLRGSSCLVKEGDWFQASCCCGCWFSFWSDWLWSGTKKRWREKKRKKKKKEIKLKSSCMEWEGEWNGRGKYSLFLFFFFFFFS